MNQLQDALITAIQSHHNQTRKCGVLPYVIHPIEVMKTLWNWGVRDEATLIAALLHDTLEDTSLTEEEIQVEFGEYVCTLVKELTFKDGSKKDYLQSFKDKSIDSLLIKVADRVCNVHDFMQDNIPYARPYFKRAYDLFDTCFQRGEEIRPMVALNISNSIESLADLLDKSYS